MLTICPYSDICKDDLGCLHRTWHERSNFCEKLCAPSFDTAAYCEDKTCIPISKLRKNKLKKINCTHNVSKTLE